MSDRDESSRCEPVPTAPRAPADPPVRRSRWQRLTDWTSRHGPQTLAGGLLIAVLAALAPVVAEKLLDDDPEPGKTPGRAVDGASATDGKPAPKESCSGETCAHLDPKDPGCDARVVTLAQLTEPVTLQIRYSTVCAAAWGRIRQAQVGDKVWITTADDRRAADAVGVGHDAYTRMVPAAGEFRLTACAEADASDGEPRWSRACVTATEKDVPLEPSAGASRAGR
ncbi:MAG TPA: DUF2690 domain-containing protein [Streptomyces sp.]|nr:DUF2690 domain-containing protein [Streptomyces sp.]